VFDVWRKTVVSVWIRGRFKSIVRLFFPSNGIPPDAPCESLKVALAYAPLQILRNLKMEFDDHLVSCMQITEQCELVTKVLTTAHFSSVLLTSRMNDI
jgi:hypothetical protein